MGHSIVAKRRIYSARWGADTREAFASKRPETDSRFCKRLQPIVQGGRTRPGGSHVPRPVLASAPTASLSHTSTYSSPPAHPEDYERRREQAPLQGVGNDQHRHQPSLSTDGPARALQRTMGKGMREKEYTTSTCAALIQRKHVTAAANTASTPSGGRSAAGYSAGVVSHWRCGDERVYCMTVSRCKRPRDVPRHTVVNCDSKATWDCQLNVAVI